MSSMLPNSIVHSVIRQYPHAAGGCDKTAKMWSLQTNQSQVVARHDAPIRHLFSVKDMSSMLVTGGWDKTVRYWDLRQPNPVHVQQLPERVYAMDVRYPLAVVGLANRRIQARPQVPPARLARMWAAPGRWPCIPPLARWRHAWRGSLRMRASCTGWALSSCQLQHAVPFCSNCG